MPPRERPLSVVLSIHIGYRPTRKRVRMPFRRGMCQPTDSGSLRKALSGIKARQSRFAAKKYLRCGIRRRLRLERLELRQMLAAAVYVNDDWVEAVNGPGAPGVLDTGDLVDNRADPGP